MNKLTIVLTGKKQSGKSTMCNYIRARYLNLRWERDVAYDKQLPEEHRYHGERLHYVDSGGLLRIKTADGDFAEGAEFTLHPEHCKDVHVYSFADPLKDFCINVLGVPHEGCWGTDLQKNTPVPHLLWDNLDKAFHPIEFETVFYPGKYTEFSGDQFPDRYEKERKYRTGPMTGRDVMQIFGTDICRKLYGDCWARGTYNKIKSEGYELALVADARFPNEITIGNEVNAKTVRLGRNVSNDTHMSEIALDDFAKEKYTLFVDNSDFTIAEQCANLDPYIDKWFKEAGII